MRSEKVADRCCRQHHAPVRGIAVRSGRREAPIPRQCTLRPLRTVMRELLAIRVTVSENMPMQPLPVALGPLSNSARDGTATGDLSHPVGHPRWPCF